MNALVDIAQEAKQLDLTDWYFDPMSVQNSQTICLQRSLDDCAGFVVVNWRTGLIIKAKEAWMVGLKATVSVQQEKAYDDFMQDGATD